MLIAAITDSTTLLLMGGATAVILIATIGAFFAGVMCAPWLQEWAVRRASAQIHRMFELVIGDVERAQRMCAELASATGGKLSALEWQRMDQLQQQFQQTFSRLTEVSAIAQKPKDETGKSLHASDFAIEWVKAPLDTVSGLPDKQAFEQNLSAMLARGAETELESGLLLICMDKADSLRRRLGADAVDKLLTRMTSLVVRAARDQDLICRTSSDTLGLLCPALPTLAGCKVAEKIREAIRNYHFRVQDGGPEVLVTASFGYANCGPADSADLVRERAADSLARSQSLGRNQLHVHDGQTRALCRN